MNKKRLLKSIIGTVVIYGVLLAFHFILSKMFNLGLGEWLWISIVSLVACSIAAGMLFKGELYAAVWSVATVILCAIYCVTSSVSSGWDFGSFMGVVLFILAPLLIPFFIIKAGFWLKEEEKKEKSRLE